ncbi:MAG: hypothetical protein KGP35_07225 [Bacteroidetes bacterium]|nr:hypothetical protein [Bacteroidota bacterium]
MVTNLRFAFCCGFILGFAVLFPAGLLLAQKRYSLTLQSSDWSPFYVTTGGQRFHSSKAGLMILSRLEAGDRRLQVQWKDSSISEQQFLLSNQDSNRVLILKQRSTKDWVLEDFRDSGIAYERITQKFREKMEDIKVQRSGDSFGDLLSRVTKDSSVAGIGMPLREERRRKARKEKELKSEIRLMDKRMREDAYEFIFEVGNGLGLDTIQVIIDRRN